MPSLKRLIFRSIMSRQRQQDSKGMSCLKIFVLPDQYRNTKIQKKKIIAILNVNDNFVNNGVFSLSFWLMSKPNITERVQTQRMLYHYNIRLKKVTQQNYSRAKQILTEKYTNSVQDYTQLSILLLLDIISWIAKIELATK